MSRSTVRERQEVWGRGIEPHRYRALRAALEKAPRGVRVLDYGCGQGAYVSALRKDGFECIGADLFTYPDWDVRAPELGIEKESLFRQVKDLSLPFPDGYFHTVFSFEVLEHCPDAPATLREMVRVATHGIVVSVPDCDIGHKLRKHDLAFSHWTDTSHLNFFTEESFRELVTGVGLQIVEVGRAYRVDLHQCFWEHVQMLPLLKRFGRWATRGCVEPYWSSLLIRARKA